jgi:endonuclease/exonuclease/phosphatase family metal-dependent hydrolase
MPKPVGRIALLALIVAGPAMVLTLTGCQPAPSVLPPGSDGSYLFCFWNVENLFDDRDDDRTGPGDREYDRWFARDSAALKLKLANLSSALLKLNDGRGPDILALAEVENTRAADLLRQALNVRLSDASLQYRTVLMKDLAAGRHIAPAIITRLPVLKDRTQLLGKQQRILEAHIVVNDRELVVLASHWTSRVSDREGKGRAHYADAIYGRFLGMYKRNPKIDLVVCGDFNDPPDAPSVAEHLHATGDLDALRKSVETDRPKLFNLFANLAREERTGTHYYHGKWFTFDQIVVSPAMLDDEGWSCDPKSAQIIDSLYRPGDRQRRPWRFGNEHDKGQRGYSDHFPVTVRLKVQGAG